MKKLIATLALLSTLATANAQFSFTKSISVGQTYVEKAIADGIIVVRQSFQIADKDGERYGFRGKNEFGISYTLGIKVHDGLIINDKAVRPWDYDSNFDKYRGKYSPLLYQCSYSPTAEAADYQELDCANAEAWCDSTVYHVGTDLFGGQGFTLDTTTGVKDGWVVWITADKGADRDQNAAIEVVAIRNSKVEVETPDQAIAIGQLTTESDIIGGFFLVPAFTGIGTMEFHLCGIIVPADGKYELRCPFVGMEAPKPAEEAHPDDAVAADEGTEVAESDPETPELTPIEDSPTKDKDKKKKDKKKKK